jgi:N-acetylmuramoyl-L-alanine amidase
MKVAICVGHSRRGDRGAISVGGVAEWSYNNEVAKLIKSKLDEQHIDAVVINAYDANSYGRAMGWVATRLQELRCTVAVELHFNCADAKAANGHEWLYYEYSGKSKALAQNIHHAAEENWKLKSRGLKPIDASDRGAGFLTQTHCPAVICEPFFGSNAADWKYAKVNQELLATTITSGIYTWIKNQ